jgi:hypothetical protein
MDARLSSDGVDNCSSVEFHEHGDYKRMVESQEKEPRLVVEVNK